MSENTETTEATPAVTPEQLDQWENESIPKSQARGVVNALIAEVRRLTSEAEKPRRTRKPKETPAEPKTPESNGAEGDETGEAS